MKALKQAAKALQFFKSIKELNEDKKNEIALAQIQKILGEEKALFLKIGQFLGLKKEYSQLMDVSYDFEQILSIEEVKKVFFKEFSTDFDDHFEILDRKPKSASLSQVFYCREKEGRELLVLKTQLPGIKDSIQSQLRLLKLVPNAGPAKKWGVNIEAYKLSISQLLDKELNFDHEMHWIECFSGLFKAYDYFFLPKLHKTYQSKQMYFQSEVPGEALSSLIQRDLLSEGQKRFLLKAMFEFHCIAFIKMNALQTDGNLGNFHFISSQENLKLGILDFGAVKGFDEKFVLGMLRLYLAVKNKTADSPLALLQAVGFEEKKLQMIRPKLPILLNLLLEPFVSVKPVMLSNWNLNERLDSLLGEHKWWFRSAGGQDFFLLMKAFSSYLDLAERWNLSICFSEIIDKHLSSILLDVVNLELAEVDEDDTYTMSLMATEIMVHIKENGKDKVKLKMPIRIIAELESYMDEDILLKLQERGISCKDKVENFLESGGKPAVLFSFQDGSKDYLVKAL
ncbi:MAG: AarF/UbiB family protein [Bdellovibrionota bacterium]|nr:AarF/UbiB family protein [Bdellovibrionota bacterium]